MEIAQIVASQPMPGGNGIAVVSNSVALASVVADAAGQNGLQVVVQEAEINLEDGQSRALPRLAALIGAVLANPEVHCGIITLLPSVGVMTDALAECIREAAAAAGKPVVAVFTGIIDASIPAEGLLATGTGEDGTSHGLPCYSSPGAAVNALAAIVRYAAWVARDQGEVIPPEGINVGAAADFIEQVAGRRLRA